MKKLMLSVIVIFVLTSTNHAADKKQTAVKNPGANEAAFTEKAVSAMVVNYAILQEENQQLKQQATELNNKMEDLKSQLDFNNMMHTTIFNLHQEQLLNETENAKSQLDYASMMSTTLLNLGKLKKAK